MIDNDRGFLPDASVEGPPFDTLNRADSRKSAIPATTDPLCGSCWPQRRRCGNLLHQRCSGADAIGAQTSSAETTFFVRIGRDGQLP